jgi:hypothetical protein
VVDTVVGTWNLVGVNGRSIPTTSADYTTGAQAVLVSAQLTVGSTGRVIESGTYAPSGVVLADHTWPPQGTQYVLVDTGTCTPAGDAVNAGVSFPLSGRTGAIGTSSWYHINFVITGSEPLLFRRAN